MHFDVMDNKWLHCIITDGTAQDLSLRETILSAHKIKRVVTPSRFHFSEYTLNSFITDFVQDVYKPSGDIEEIIEIALDEGHFEEERLEKYIKEYKEDGFSFDLFNEKVPFMQTPTNKIPEKVYENSKYLSALGIEFGSGNEVSFFNNNRRSATEDQGELTPCETILQLLYVTAYRHAYAPSLSSISCGDKSTGFHPIFVMNYGKTLYETIVLSWRTEKSSCTPIWRRKPMSFQKIILSKDFDPLTVTYVQNFYIKLKDFRSCYFSEIDWKPEKEKYTQLVRDAYEKWVVTYPRVIYEVVKEKDKETEKIVERSRACTYVEKDEKNLKLETKKLDLGLNWDHCFILKENRRIADELGYDVTTKFYSLIHSNKIKTKGVVQLECCYTWKSKKMFPNQNAKHHLKKCLEAIDDYYKDTIYTITYMDNIAKGNSEPNLDGKYSSIARMTADDCVNTCMWLLDKTLYDSLFDTTKDTPEEVRKAIHLVFLNAIKQHRVARGDLIAKGQALNGFVRRSESFFSDKKTTKKKRK